MLHRKTKLVLLCLVVIYLLVVLKRSISIPSYASKTEFSSNKIKLARELEKNSNWKLYGFNFQSNSKPRLPGDSTLRQQLAFQFPYEPKRPFEKNIWQTWKVPLNHPAFPPNYAQFLKSWDQKNPGYSHFVLPDEECHEFIAQTYASVPDVAKAYSLLPENILKADFFRYLVLYARGGVYSDIDTVCIKPIDKWVSNNKTIYDKPNTAGLVIGIEADPDRPDWKDWYARRIQFCQWTIQSKKGHPMLRELVASITEHTLERNRKNQLKKILGKDRGGDIMNWTGPGIFTDKLFEYLNNALQSEENFRNNRIEEIVTWNIFTGIEVAAVVDDVIVLPITSFSPDVGQMGAKSTKDPWCYAKHMFAGSWKDDEKPKHKPKPKPAKNA